MIHSNAWSEGNVLYHARSATRSQPRDAARRAGLYIERASTRHATEAKHRKNGRAALRHTRASLVPSRHGQTDAKVATGKFLGICICQTMESAGHVRYIFKLKRRSDSRPIDARHKIAVQLEDVHDWRQNLSAQHSLWANPSRSTS
jgi:hypothetical protein